MAEQLLYGANVKPAPIKVRLFGAPAEMQIPYPFANLVEDACGLQRWQRVTGLWRSGLVWSKFRPDAKLDFFMTVHMYGMSIQSIDCKYVFWPFRPMLCNNENGQARFRWSLYGANARRLLP